MSNIADLVVQVGKETTFGTGVAATAKLRGLTRSPQFQPRHDSEVLEEIGTYGPSSLAVLNSLGAEGSLEGHVLYEDDPMLMDALFGVAAPTGSGTYTYAHAAPLTSAPTSPRLETIEYGDAESGGPNYKMVSAVTTKVTYKGENSKALTYTRDVLGHSIVATTLTGALTDRAVEPVHGAQVAVYVDTWAGTMGSTAVSATAFAFELELDSGRNLGYFFGGLLPTDWDEGFYTATLKMTMKFNATSKAYLDSLLGSATAVSQRQVRLKATSGTKIWQKDIAGTFVEPPRFWENRNNAVTVQFTLKGTYHSTFANYFKSSVTNAVSVMP